LKLALRCEWVVAVVDFVSILSIRRPSQWMRRRRDGLSLLLPYVVVWSGVGTRHRQQLQRAAAVKPRRTLAAGIRRPAASGDWPGGRERVRTREQAAGRVQCSASKPAGGGGTIADSSAWC